MTSRYIYNQKLISLLYFVTIFIFAALYANINNGFFEPSIKTERSYGDASAEITLIPCKYFHDLNKMVRSIRTLNAGVDARNEIITDDPIRCKGLKVLDDRRISIDMYYTTSNYMVVKNDEKQIHLENRITTKLSVPETSCINIDQRINISQEADNPDDLPRTTLHAISGNGDSAPLTFADARWLLEFYRENHYSGGFITVDTKDKCELIKFLNGSDGYTSALKDNFVRMIYFSTTTITSLGFGDIYPITTLSRTLSALEALLGVVLVGLFLNAIAHIAANRPNP